MRRAAIVLISFALWFAPWLAGAQDGALVWKTSWIGAPQGPYPVGNPSAQPDQRFAFPSRAPAARDQTFRLIVRPTLWGPQARLRFSNAFGTRPITFDDIHVGLHLGAAAVVPGTSRVIRFGGQPRVTVEAGSAAWSDAIDLRFAGNPADPLLQGRKLAITFHVAGESGPMTWHAKALQTSYVTAPGAGAKGGDEGEAAFVYSTSSWFFLDAVDMLAPAATPVVVAFGDSITDGTASTMNGDDRWPDVLSRRLHAAYGNRVAVVNAGIGGNQVAGPAQYGAQKPFPGGPSAQMRIDRDVIELSGVSAMIWLEGINDFSRNGNASVEKVQSAIREVVARLRGRGIRVIGATVVTALGSTSAAHGFAEQDQKRRALNEFIRTSGLFDAVVDFDAATLDPTTGGLRSEFVPDSTAGGPGDKLHPNRSGYHAMGFAVDAKLLAPTPKP